MAAGFASFDREAAAHGVTTAFLAQSWSWEGAHRAPAHAEAVMAALEDYRPRALTDLRIQIRAETHLVQETDRLIEAVRRFRVGYVVFNDHLEEGLQMWRMDEARFDNWARKLGKRPRDLAQSITVARDSHDEVPRSLRRLADAFDRMGVQYGSHDDPDMETRETYRMIGARIAEFPLTARVAAGAFAMQSPVVMGAPNVVRGQSQAGNVSALDLILAGHCDALVSDYHVPAMPMAAWALVDRGVMGIDRAWAMISTNPARILGLADRGRLDPGLRADLVVVKADTRAIEATITGGRLSYLSGEAGQRFLAQPLVARMAAE
jgi:alpha-D-ribose 1-methylphosphonate 5-triphosphate diphosphatase